MNSLNQTPPPRAGPRPFLAPVLLGLLLSALLARLTLRRVVVRGWSMYPTLAPGERVLFARVAYRFGPPRRGDIVLASHPARPDLRLVKRLAALPGDAVSLGEDRRTLGQDEYLLLGDAPDASTDSRQLGPVRRRDLLARAWLVYWPLRRARLVR